MVLVHGWKSAITTPDIYILPDHEIASSEYEVEKLKQYEQGTDVLLRRSQHNLPAFYFKKVQEAQVLNLS